jgi:hypothetical protein
MARNRAISSGESLAGGDWAMFMGFPARFQSEMIYRRIDIAL